MEKRTIQDLGGLQELVAAVYEVEEPVVVLDDESECLIAMRPAMLERILFDTVLIGVEGPASLHL